MELESKSLERGGSESDASTLDSMIEADPGSAAKLFELMLSIATKPVCTFALPGQMESWMTGSSGSRMLGEEPGLLIGRLKTEQRSSAGLATHIM